VLGQAVAAMGRALGMRVLFAGYKGQSGQGPLYTPFEQTLAESDIITLHCPLTPQTRQMIGHAEFELMKRKPLLINTARGGLVNEAAVGPALDAGHISGAAFDVVSEEPPPADHPFMHLLDRPDFILTPHVAWASDEAVQTLADQLVSNIEAFCRGEAVNVVS
jgi:glycerate dehydrogenase